LTTVAVSVALAIVILGTGVAGLVVANRGGGTFRSPDGLLVNGDVRPVGVDPDQVAFAWRVTDDRHGARQTGYRILVAKDARPTGRERRRVGRR
jgi:hypothetical protein